MARGIVLSAEALLALIAAHPEGVGSERLRAALPGVSQATLSRRLRELRDAGRIQAEGQGAARRYRAVSVAVPEAEEVAPLSPEARALRAYLRQPVATRVPVGYRRELLEGYRPDRDFLLPAPLREKLARLGHTEGTRPAGTYAREILDRLLVDLSWASSRLEGNTYTLLDTRRLIEEGTRAEGRSAEEALMILNHKRAIELLVDQAEDLGFSAMLVRNLHACLAEGLVADPAAAGALRAGAVYIERSAYLPPQLPQVVEEMFALFLARASAISDPFEQSFFALVHIPYLQPFADVNKRTARLAANIPLIRENLCPLSFVDVTERDYVDAVLGVYERLDTCILRDLYEWAYERSSARYRAVRDSLGKPDPFRVRYRQELARAVRAVVLGEAADEQQAVEIADPRRVVPPPDRERLCALVETELTALHEGNFARFGLTPRQFLTWRNRQGRAP
jgi:Fic family protein